MADRREDVDLNPDGGLETLVDLRRPAGASDSSLTGVPSIILDPNEFRLERMLRREHLVYGVPTPFVGRRRELEVTYNAVRDAVNQRKLRTISAIGGAGLGKTRLLSEMFAIIDPLKRGIEVYAGSCSESEAPDGIGVIAQLLRRRFRISPRDSEEQAHERILAAVEPLVEPGRLPAAARQLGHLAGLRTPGTSPQRDPARFQHLAVRTFFNLILYHAERAPQIMVVHRSQYLTPRTTQILSGLVRALAATPTVLFLMGDVPAPAMLSEAAAVHLDINLGPLPTKDMERLVRAILVKLPSPPEGLIADLIARSDGNARLAEDNIRLLIQRGAIVPDEERWSFRRDRLGGHVDLAGTTEAASRARVAGLPRDMRRVLEAASAFGPAFWRGGLLALLRVRPVAPIRPSAPWLRDEAGDWLDGVLERACKEDLISAHPRSALDGQVEYSFHMRDDRMTLYNELDPANRSLYHRLAAQWLAGLHLAEPAPWHSVVAEHHEAGGRPERAAAWYLEAGDVARRAYDLERARAHYLRAVALVDLDRLEILLPLLRGLGETRFAGGEFAEARRGFGALLEATVIAGDRESGAYAWLMLGQCHRALGDYTPARICFRYAKELYAGLEDSAGMASVLDQQAKVVWHEGQDGAYDEARRFFEQALALRRSVGEAGAIAETLANIANVDLHQGRIDEALEGYSEALQLRRGAGDRVGEAAVLVGLGAVRHARKDHRRALEAWRAGLELAERLGDRELIGIFLNNLGEVYLEVGDVERARSTLIDARDVTAETGDLRTAADVYRNLGSLAIAQSDWERALEAVDESSRICKLLGIRPALGVALRTRAVILGHQLYGDETDPRLEAGAAARCFEEAIALFDDVGDALELQRTLEAYAQHLAERGDHARAQRMLARAAQLGETVIVGR